MGSIWLITGGVRSGKSRLAARLASESGLAVTYIATAEAGDDEMVARIASHQEERPSEWTTIEEPIDLAGAVRGVEMGCVLIDCLTVWASNRLYPEWPSEGLSVAESKAAQATLLEAVQETIALLAKREGRAIVVTNEVGERDHPRRRAAAGVSGCAGGGERGDGRGVGAGVSVRRGAVAGVEGAGRGVVGRLVERLNHSRGK